MTGPTTFNAAVDTEGRVTIPKPCRQFLDIEPGAGTVAVAVANEPFRLPQSEP